MHVWSTHSGEGSITFMTACQTDRLDYGAPAVVSLALACDEQQSTCIQLLTDIVSSRNTKETFCHSILVRCRMEISSANL